MNASDIDKEGWVDRFVPAEFLPYARLARLDRPIGTWLLLIPCWWGLGLAWASEASVSVPIVLWYGLLFALGALAMRGAGCTYNDIVDRDVDARVARTAERPIPSGAVTVASAWIFAALLAAVGALVLFALAWPAILIGLASLPLIALYPYMKRITYWPQAWLGLTFNWGALVGWAAAMDGLGLAPLILYLAGIAWTLGYDTIYAHQDKEDDALIGVRSTALLFGEASPLWLWHFYGLTIVLLAAAGWWAGVAWPFYIALAGMALQLAWQAHDWQLDDPADCLAKFRSNRWAGWGVVLGLFVAGIVERLG
ncbi:MAG: 4-hydroxybenzoate octaprenyltransferase [Alphaproteobacteria bacterium]|nr:4-hydroxybenzoate octaprenyltransferase [Alphaproteobacteria bacterium]